MMHLVGPYSGTRIGHKTGTVSSEVRVACT
jgi:hypothetical protein